MPALAYDFMYVYEVFYTKLHRVVDSFVFILSYWSVIDKLII